MVAGVHNRYSYKLKAPTKEMIAAQGLGTVLRLARKLGPVLIDACLSTVVGPIFMSRF